MLAERTHVRDVAKARALAAARPINYMIFDMLSANGTNIMRASYVERRELLESVLPSPGQTPWAVPPRFPDGPATLEAAKELTLEGVVAKRLSSPYRPGLRATDWIKVKHELTGDYVVGGWHTKTRTLSGLLVGLPGEAGLIYRGRVGGGISNSTERELLALFGPLRTATSPFARGQVPREDTVGTTWVRPELVVEIKYGLITRDGKLRFPRYLRMRPDKAPEETADG
jgi:bifunctional non-homologous end joining protein LigD